MKRNQKATTWRGLSSGDLFCNPAVTAAQSQIRSEFRKCWKGTPEALAQPNPTTVSSWKAAFTVCCFRPHTCTGAVSVWISHLHTNKWITHWWFVFDQKHLVMDPTTIQAKDYDPGMSSVWSAGMSNGISDLACHMCLPACMLIRQDEGLVQTTHENIIWINSSSGSERVERAGFLLRGSGIRPMQPWVHG